MDQTVRVAVVRGERRRGAVAQALALIADDLRDRITPHVLVTPDLGSPHTRLASTHADTLSATLDFLLALGAREVTVAGGAPGSSAAFRRLGYEREAFGRPVRFLDLGRDEREWEPLGLTSAAGTARAVRLSSSIARAGCRVSLAAAGTHGAPGVALGLMNMTSALHPDDQAAALGSTVAPDDNVVALARRILPHVSVVDGFVGTERQRSRRGTPARSRTVVAGTDAVAVDAVAAAVVGFEPLRVGRLRRAQDAGLGLADLSRVTVLGDPVEAVSRPFAAHPDEPLRRVRDRVDPRSAPTPHALTAQSVRHLTQEHRS
jgi:uncharacterized protein (DUF362 family)